MAEGHGWGGASRAGSNHPALASASAAPPYPRRGALSRTYVAVYKGVFYPRDFKLMEFLTPFLGNP